MYRAPVYAHWSARLHASAPYAMAYDALCQFLGRRFGTTSALQFRAADVHEAVQEGAGGQDYGLGAERNVHVGLHARHLLCLLVHEQFPHLVLPDAQVLRVLQNLSPFPDELCPVALCPGTPHGRPLATVQHPELNGGAVGNLAGMASQGIDLANYLPFGNAADGRVARHLRNLVHVHGHQARPGAQPCTGRRCLATGMPGAYYNNVVIEFHLLCLLFHSQKYGNSFYFFLKALHK